MTNSNELRGAALTAAARAEAKHSGYATVVNRGNKVARRYEPDGSYSDGKIGSYGFCVNFYSLKDKQEITGRGCQWEIECRDESGDWSLERVTGTRKTALKTCLAQGFTAIKIRQA